MIPNNPSSRETMQSRMIRSYLKSNRIHPTAETIHHHLSKEIPTISISTVYRNLNKMVEQGEAHAFDICGHKRFDCDLSEHYHLLCECCGTLTDSFEDSVTRYVLSKTHTDTFRPIKACITVSGICKECDANTDRI